MLGITINAKAAQTAFWIIYWYIFIAAILSNIVIIQMKAFTVFNAGGVFLICLFLS